MQTTTPTPSSRTAWLHCLTPFFVLVGLTWLFGLVFAFEVDTDLVWDWFQQEGTAIYLWWLFSSLAGLAVLPILFKLLPMLPSRGYALARTAGIMLTAFVFWFVGSLGLWKNTPGSIGVAWLMVIALGVWVWRRGGRGGSVYPPDHKQGISSVHEVKKSSEQGAYADAPLPDFRLKDWWREHWTLVIVVEIVFIAMLFGWAMYRAHEPEIRSTEKPMEMMFVNSIRQSEFFPPDDGWLAGYSISYYYFGYVIIAGLADLSGVNSGIAFGLAGPLLFALSGIGILGLVYDLVRLRRGRSGRHGAIWAGLIGIVMLVIMGNLGTFFIEMPWNGKGILPARADPSYFEFWGVPERSHLAVNQNPQDPDAPRWYIPSEDRTIEGELPNTYVAARDLNSDGIADFAQPDLVIAQDPETGEDITLKREFQNWDFWWWFRYSRVIEDQDLDGNPIGVQPIAEFPMFSFVLADMHPHVLALPFALLALTLAAGVALGKGELRGWEIALMAIWVGGMVFLNSWDAVYIPFLIAAYGLRRHMNNAGGLSWRDWLRIGVFALLIGVLSFLFYAPWIFSFTSQAGGIYFNVIWATQPQQLFLQFGVFFVLLLPFLGQQVRRGWYQIRWLGVVIVFLILFAMMVILPFGAAGVYEGLCGENTASSACQARNILLAGSSVLEEDFGKDLLTQRLPACLSEGLLLAGIVFIGFRLWGRQRDTANRELPYEPATAFALLVVAAGFALILLPDFVYLVDNFRVRINTVFKLYYQAWIFLSVGTAFSVYAVLSRLSDVWTPPARNERGELEREITYPPRASWQLPYVMGLLAILGMGLFYPFYGVRTRALDETGRYAAQEVNAETQLTLDGRPSSVSPEEWAVIQCFADLNPPPDTVIAEAPFNGGYHMEYGRVATLTGVPNLLGWINHEGQWRGSAYDSVTEVVRAENGVVIDSREMQVDKLYRTTDWVQAQAVITRYGIDYIMLGFAERSRYTDIDPYALEKFDDYLQPICQAGEVKLYQVSG